MGLKENVTFIHIPSLSNICRTITFVKCIGPSRFSLITHKSQSVQDHRGSVWLHCHTSESHLKDRLDWSVTLEDADQGAPGEVGGVFEGPGEYVPLRQPRVQQHHPTVALGVTSQGAHTSRASQVV